MPHPTLPWTPLMHHESGDVDEQAALLAGWQQDYAQVSGGAFHGSVDEVWLGGARLFVEHTGRRLLQRGALPAGRLALGLPLSLGSGPISFGGATDWDSGQSDARFCSFSGQGGFEFATPQDLVMSGVELPLSLLDALAVDEEQEALARLAARSALHAADPAALRAFRDWLQQALALMREAPERLADERARQALRQALLSNLLALLPLADGLQQPVSPLPQWTLVARAQALVREDPETPHTVADLCSRLRVSRRSLQAAFQKVLGLPPATYLRAQRLAGAHRALRDARSVAEAATQWGFWHLGLFAQDHRRMFGETPSQTWRRLHPSKLH